ncbi:MAG: type II toxin-antitoxin system VapC family toxin [Armatimonadota bacterium]|nr:type II toxin-antitoxin system VapC family toxin [Armatimonadota bacterium]
MGATSSDEGEIELPQRLYLDTQFCVAYHWRGDRDHPAASRFALVLKQLAEANAINCYVSALVLDELAWKLGGIIYDRDNGRGSWQSAPSKKNAFRTVKDEVAGRTEDFLYEPWLRALGIPDTAYYAIPTLMRRYSLCSADLCHLAWATTAGCGIITNDADFHRLRNPSVHVVGY